MPGTPAVLTKKVSVLGDTYDFSDTVYSDMAGPRLNVALAAAKVGQLTTRTSNTVGTLTMVTGHGITTAAVIDIYWSGGRRFQVTVGTVSGLSVPFTVGQGDNLPVNLTAVTVMVVHQESLVLTAANIVLAAAACPGADATVVFTQSDGTFVAALRVNAAAPKDGVWYTGYGTTPFGADVGKVFVSHGDSAATRTITSVTMYN